MPRLHFLAAFAALLAASSPLLAGSGDQLAGRWSVAELHGKAPDTPAGDITFELANTSISGATACNLFRGSFKASGGNALEIKVGRMTRRGCVGGAAEHERSFLNAMAATRTFQITGDRLTLTAADGALLAELIRTPDAALEGPRHKIVSYLMDGGLYSTSPDTGAAIKFEAGNIEGYTGCRPFTASYARAASHLKITAVAPAQTIEPCDESVRDQDAAILAALARVTTFDTSRNLIRLLEQTSGAAMLWITPQTTE